MRRSLQWATCSVLAVVVGLVGELAVGPVPALADVHRDRQWYLSSLNLTEAHQHSLGEGVTVAVLDSGVDRSHPDLSGNVLPGKDYLDDAGDGSADANGHGTHMACLIAAHGRGTDGVLGVAPKAKILPIRIADGDVPGVGRMPSAIEWAVAQRRRSSASR